MSAVTEISWAESTWNPVSGCTKVSPGCDHCYIERTPPFRMAHRKFDRPGIGGTTGVVLHPERLGVPGSWRKPRRIFVCSLADLFHDAVPDAFIAGVFAIMALNPQHVFQVLTKRPARARTLLGGDGASLMDAAVDEATADVLSRQWPLPNVWFGTTAEDQKWADIRIPELLGIPAAVRWVSAEPLLGPIDLTRMPFPKWSSSTRDDMVIDAVGHRYGVPGQWQAKAIGIDWIVCGGESGPGARPMSPEWAADLRDQCVNAGVPYHFKQWGEWCAPGEMPEQTFRDFEDRVSPFDPEVPVRVGKRAAGRLLGGREWNEYPAEVTA